MSIKLMAAAWELDIPSAEKMVLLCLCDFAGDHGSCWPSIKTIARKCSKSERTVQGAIRWLRDHGYCDWNDTPGKPHMFTLNPRNICTPADSAPPQKLRQTPADSAPKPLRTTNTSEAKASSVDPIAAAWNAMCDKSGLGKVRKLTPERLKALAARRKDYSDAEILEAVERIGRSKFCCGSTGFRADFDFLLSPSKLPRILEGKYDDGGGAKYTSASGYEYRGSLRDIMREAERRADTATYWAVKAQLDETKPTKRRAEPPADPKVAGLVSRATRSLRAATA